MVTADGVEISSSTMGSGTRGFVLVHGWCCDRSAMAPLARRLGRRGRTVNVDLRGHGASAPPTQRFDVEGFVADVQAAAKGAALEQPVLVGHSMGGRVVLAAAQREPALASALVLLDAAIVEDPGYVAARRRELDQDGWSDSFKARIDRLWLDSDSSVRRRRITHVMLRTPRNVAVGSLDAADAIDAPAALAGFAGPVLYIAASTAREQMATLRALKPDLMYAQVAGSGHFVQLDALSQVAAMIERFCELADLGTI